MSVKYPEGPLTVEELAKHEAQVAAENEKRKRAFRAAQDSAAAHRPSATSE